MTLINKPLHLTVLAAALCAALPSYADTEPTVLEPVFISSSRITSARETVPFGTSIITAQDIERSGVSTVNEALMKLMGIVGRLDTSGGGEYTIDLRGFGETSSSNQVVIVDGIRMNEADSSSARLAGIPIESIYSIEIVRGGSAVLYGENATAGAIIITTKSGKGATQKNTASIYTAVGNYGLKTLRTSASYSKELFSAQVSASNELTDNHRDNFKSHNHAISATAQWSNDVARGGFRVSSDSLKSGLPGSLSAVQYQNNPHIATKPSDNGLTDNQSWGAFTELLLGKWQLGLDVGQREKKSIANYISTNDLYESKINANTIIVKAQHNQSFGDYKNNLQFGYDFNQWKKNASTSNSQSNSIYLRDELTALSLGTTVSLGFRHDSTQRSLLNWSGTSWGVAKDTPKAWEIGLRQTITPVVSGFIRLGSSYRLPNIDEMSGYTTTTMLKAQESNDAEIGIDYKTKQFKLNLRVYRHGLTNEIAFEPPSNGIGYGSNVNLDPTRKQGLEIENALILSPNVSIRTNLALRQSNYSAGSFAGKDTKLAPKKTLSSFTDIRIHANHSVSAGFSWVGSQYTDEANKCVMPSYMTIDTAYRYTYKNIQLSAGINNLLDKKYYTQAYVCNASNGEVSAIYPEAGRAIKLTARIQF